MLRLVASIVIGLTLFSTANAQNMILSVSSNEFQVTPVFSAVDTFGINIEIDGPLAAGQYINPDIVSVSYGVSGTLVAGTPSGFPAFALQRDMTGTEFYAQGSSLSFDIMPTAVLSDGVQATELVGSSLIFTFNGREIGNGRFHPALLELNMDGTGRIQNSNNIVVEVPLQEVNFGDEYITDLMFDPGNTTLITGTPPPPPPPVSGGGAVSPLGMGLLSIVMLLVRRRRRI